MSDVGVSVGEGGGILAGIVVVLGVFGRGVVWVNDRLREARSAREAKLEAREAKIDESEDTFRRRLENRLQAAEQRQAELEGRDAQRELEHRSLRLAFELVAGALRAMDPGNVALRQAEQLLIKAFPLSPGLPPVMAEHLGAIDRMGTTGGD